jgi:iron complex outermembrane receptor protein
MQRRNLSWPSVYALPWAAVPLAVHAQPPPLEPEIVVTAPRTESPLEVLTDPSKPRQPLPAHDGADYLKTIPGFSVIRKGGTDGDAVFRGMAGSRVVITTSEDMLLGGCGMRMDPPTAYVFPQNYDRIRVLKGPQSVLWGTGGSAATVRFERDRFRGDADDDHVSGSALVGSAQRRDLAADAQFASELGFLRFQGSDARADDYEDGSGNEVHSRYDRWNALATAGWTPSDDTVIELSAGSSDGEAAYADRAMDGVVFDRESLTFRASHYDISERIGAIEGQLAYGYVDHVMDNYSLRTFVPSMMMPSPMASNPDRRTLALRLSTALTLTPLLSADVGLDAHEDEHSNRSSMNDLMVSYRNLARVDDASYDQQGLFAEFSYEAAPGRVIESGVRVDSWRATDLRTTVRQGMMTMPNATAGAVDRDTLTSGFIRYEHGLKREAGSGAPDVIVFAGLGHSERIADYWERFGNDKQSVATNSAFFTAPERTTQLDFGVLRESEHGQMSVSLFASQIADYILIDTLVAGKPMGTVVTRNVDAATVGGEVEVSRHFAERWMLESSVAYTRGENRTDDLPLAQMPPLEARASLVYTGARFSVGGLVRWADDQHRIDLGRGNIVGQDVAPSDSFTVLSLNASYRLTTKVNLSMGIDNLLDETYAEHLSRAGAMVPGYVQSQRVNEPGETLWLKVDVRP